MPWGGSVLVKSIWCPGGFLYLNGQNFPKIWKFFGYYLVDILHIPLACTSSPSSVPMILRFSGLVFWWSHWVLAYSFYSSFVIWLIFLLFFL
jgi:hypothetical protein